MDVICGDNRFEIIAKAKAHLLDVTNIDTSEDEMKVLDDFLFRCWQMGWLDRYDDRKTENGSEKPNNCEELNAYRECVKSRSFWDSKHCDGCYFDERCPFDEPKDEPQTERYCTNCKHNGVIEDYECRECCGMDHHEFIEPQTDCAWK